MMRNPESSPILSICFHGVPTNPHDEHSCKNSNQNQGFPLKPQSKRKNSTENDQTPIKKNTLSIRHFPLQSGIDFACPSDKIIKI